MTRFSSRGSGRDCALGVAAALPSSLWPGLLLAGGLLACSGEQVLGDYPPSTCDLSKVPESSAGLLPLSIASFWPDDKYEVAALQTLVRRIDHQRFDVSTDQKPTRIDVQLHIENAYERQQLPDVFQANGGSDVLRWVANRAGDATAVCALDSLGPRDGWSGVYFRSVLEPVSCRGQLFALPVGVHHLNLLFYNRELYATLQQTAQERRLKLLEPSELRSARDLVEQLKVIDELALMPHGKRLVPLTLGTKERWPLAILAFENVLLSLSSEAYKMLWEGGLAPGTGNSPTELAPILDEMLDVLRALVRPEDLREDLDWKEAMRQVGDGAAVFTVMGDWGWAQLSAEQRERVAAISYPGTAGTFVYTPDSFAVPRELGKNGFPARSFLEDIVFPKDALIDFANEKHCIPPRSDLEPDEVASLVSESVRSTYRQFQDCERGGCELLLAVSGLAPPPGIDRCFDDIDALLLLATTQIQPSAEQRTQLRCPERFPPTSDGAATRLVELLLQVAKQRFASECR